MGVARGGLYRYTILTGLETSRDISRRHIDGQYLCQYEMRQYISTTVSSRGNTTGFSQTNSVALSRAFACSTSSATYPRVRLMMMTDLESHGELLPWPDLIGARKSGSGRGGGAVMSTSTGRRRTRAWRGGRGGGGVLSGVRGHRRRAAQSLMESFASGSGVTHKYTTLDVR